MNINIYFKVILRLLINADYKRSAIALRRVSDKLCVEHGLSIIENPELSKGHNRAEYLGERKPPTGRDKLRELIDNSLSAGMSFADFLVALRNAGCDIKTGKQFSIKPPGNKKYFRLDTLGDDYSEAAIRERLAGTRTVTKRKDSGSDAERRTAAFVETQNRPNLLIDIQEKIAQGAGAGYVQWMKVFNLQTAARTLIFLKENGIDSYDELNKTSTDLSSEFSALTKRIKEIETKQKENNELQKYIGNYGKTRDIYKRYVASGRSRDFYDVHATEIILHQAAKKHFDELGVKKLPSINTLRQEWAALDAERRKLYSGYKAIKQKHIALGTAKANADVILFGTQRTPQKTQNRDSR